MSGAVLLNVNSLHFLVVFETASGSFLKTERWTFVFQFYQLDEFDDYSQFEEPPSVAQLPFEKLRPSHMIQPIQTIP